MLYDAYKQLFIRVALSSKSNLIDRVGTHVSNPALDRYLNASTSGTCRSPTS